MSLKLDPEDFPGMSPEQMDELQKWAEYSGRKLRESAKCRHCGEGVYLYEGRWRHVGGMYVCTLQIPRPRPRAEPREETNNERTD